MPHLKMMSTMMMTMTTIMTTTTMLMLLLLMMMIMIMIIIMMVAMIARTTATMVKRVGIARDAVDDDHSAHANCVSADGNGWYSLTR
jgi:hypothetical protein